MDFVKYQALGNDYLVVEASALGAEPGSQWIRAFCDRHRGVGADGLLLAGDSTRPAGFALRIFNPDGSEAEKSGNGLRIFARYLFDCRQVNGAPFLVATAAGAVECQVDDAGRRVRVEMGRVSFWSSDVPVRGPRREVLREPIASEGEPLLYSAASVGNPHCVVERRRVSEEECRRWGPVLERDPRFPRRTNVQFLQVLDRANLRIEIWERGAGRTLASGTSSCAAAAVAHRLGLCDSHVDVHMPGGALQVQIREDWTLGMSGPGGMVMQGRLSPEWLGVARS
jgi:diaminopimelate epimerase